MIRTPNIRDGKINLSDCRFVDAVTYKKWTRRATVDEGDVLLTREAPMGEVGRVGFNDTVFLGQRIVQYRADPRKLDSHFLLYSFRSAFLQAQFRKHDSSGSIVSHIPVPACTEFEIPTPPLPDQRKIAKVLSTLDAKIELNNRINVELEGMAKHLYDYWFVQFDFPITAAQAASLGKPQLAGKPYRSSGGKMIYNEVLKREIPEGWNAGTAENLLIFNPSLSLRDGTEAGFFDMDAVPTCGFMTKAVQRKAFTGGIKFANGDVVVARITPCLENGKTALITQLEDGQVGFGSTEFIVMRGKARSLSAFGACLARSEHFRKFAILNMTGTSGRKRIEAPILKTFPLSIPPIALLSIFEDICEPIFQKMTANEKENQELIQLRDWLLPMLMNGQVTVN